MNYEYNTEAYLEVIFPTRNVPSCLFKHDSIKRIFETRENDVKEMKPMVTILLSDGTRFYFDGTMEDFKKNAKTVYL